MIGYQELINKTTELVEDRLKNKKLIMTILKLYGVEERFRELEKLMVKTHYPDNLANKSMGSLYEVINSFEIVLTRYRANRIRLRELSLANTHWWKTHPKAKSRKTDSREPYVNGAIRVDAESLFVFGLILVQRSLLIINLFLPDKPSQEKFSSLTKFYNWIRSSGTMSPLAQELRKEFGENLKWLYAVLRFYRNEFIEHVNRGYQVGMGYSNYENSFNLSAYKWDYSPHDSRKIDQLKKKIVKRKIVMSEEIDQRHYLHLIFQNIQAVPDDLLEECLDLIEDIGGDSPDPEVLISQIESYLNQMFNFMIKNFDKSEFAKYKNE